MGLKDAVDAVRLSEGEITKRTAAIREAMLAQSENIHVPNFRKLTGKDLEMLFGLYDIKFFRGALAGEMERLSLPQPEFGTSVRMTSSGGKTQVRRDKAGNFLSISIIISAHLLSNNFKSDNETVTVSGKPARDRLEALQNVMEHEIIHLIEFITRGKSSCSGKNFRHLAGNIFGHRAITHEMVTTRKRAETDFGIRLGDRVRFEYDGREYFGMVNRITKRASVLVDDKKGRLFSDGKRYMVFYIPLSRCTKVYQSLSS